MTDCDPATEKVGPKPRHHLLIAGTGRAGTSFLVRYLTELGLDTHLSRKGSAAYWDNDAHAGLEDIPLLGDGSDIPYVAKSPWLYQFIDELLERDDIIIDAVILPMRDLMHTASSRSILQIRSLHQRAPHQPQLKQTWEEWGSTPGGTVFSLNPIDQARLLAVGFHKLLERLVKARIPVILIHFPSFVEDADLLFDSLRPVLAGIDVEQARAAFLKTAQRDKVRVADELEPRATTDDGKRSDQGDASELVDVSPNIQAPSHLELDNIALKREVLRLQTVVKKLQSASAKK